MTLASSDWKIWADTGGTFTDCLAIDPAGRLHRAKVLSTSAVRGRIAGSAGKNVIDLATAWDLPPGFFLGFTFRLLGKESEPRTVETTTAITATSSVTFSASMRSRLAKSLGYQSRVKPCHTKLRLDWLKLKTIRTTIGANRKM